MDDHMAVQAEYATTKRVLGRKVLQIILEVPLELEQQIYDKIGTPPMPGSSCPVGVARLKTEHTA